jgi:predicted ATPase
MRLEYIRIDAFKNLQNVEVSFERHSPYTVLVGENGSGKSNFLEAVTAMFRALDLGEKSPFGYELVYRCRGKRIAVHASSDAFPSITVQSEEEERTLSRKEFLSEDEAGPVYRPAFVFGYYSGPSSRLAELYAKHRRRYYSDLIKPNSQRRYSENPNERRRLFYAETLHGQFALLAFFMQNDQRSIQFLRDTLLIDHLDSVLFNLREPRWKRKGGDPVFWHADGEVRVFINRLFAEAFSPLHFKSRMGSADDKMADTWHLFLRDPDSLQRVYSSYGDQYRFFSALESLLISNVLAGVQVRVGLTEEGGAGEVTYRDLSEGEQQLLLVLGLLKFTAKEETLFILDEPDTHLNPLWGTQYLSYLGHFIEQADNCHILMTTHDPLVFAGLTRDEVRIFKRGLDGRAEVSPPLYNPRGMGVAAILTSDLFRLQSTLDPDTQADLDMQRLLSVKKDRTDEEEQCLRDVTMRLDVLRLRQETRDPLYRRFVEAWTRSTDLAVGNGGPSGANDAADGLADRIAQQLRLDFPDGV